MEDFFLFYEENIGCFLLLGNGDMESLLRRIMPRAFQSVSTDF
jgi:hypothetical protein